MRKTMMEAADEMLVDRARSGDKAAFATFATRWWPIIGRFSWSMLGDSSRALAVTEEVVESVLEGPQPPGIPIRHLMYRLALWLAIVRRRSSPCPETPESPVLQALEQLYPKDRAAFLLRDVEQLSCAEIAAVLEAPPAQVKARLHRARLALIGLLGDRANSVDVDAGHPIRRTA